MNSTVKISRSKKEQAVVYFLYEDKLKELSLLEKKEQDAVKTVLKTKDFEGKNGQISLLYVGEKRLFIVGLGKRKECNIRHWKQAVGSVLMQAQKKKITQISMLISKIVSSYVDTDLFAQTGTVSAYNALYAFDDFKEKEAKVVAVKSIEWIVADKRISNLFIKGVKKGKYIAEGVLFTRMLGNTPPTEMTPTLLADHAKDLEKNKNISVQILNKKQIEAKKMGCLLAVSRGSVLEPKFIIVEYKGKDSKHPTVLVGKGITYDSGGLSLKPDPYMRDMKFDMLGAATVLGIIKAAAKMGLKKHIIGLIPACENMPSGDAYRPDDILTAMNGKTVLIENTDAEGRLILADALVYAQTLQPKEVIDFATLTGACMVALGNERSGLFTPEDDLADKLDAASKNIGEMLWRLPVGEEYTTAMKSEIADIKNLGGVGNPRFGGASTAAAFLQFFTQNEKGNAYPWAHIDLSSCYYGESGKAHIRGGANGFGVETMIQYFS
ncbi:leucyl aminopeptidase [Patescibacteria group bacterium]|nr:leucyl aminopeptidase [Patescibacteria group bacterium]MBU1721318.1 leucyl aminopeptidase [Patescibacteria group bacterium]MBU1900958.1 leucyl aminopeptidase [Patescibacteria group bacterium]